MPHFEEDLKIAKHSTQGASLAELSSTKPFAPKTWNIHRITYFRQDFIFLNIFRTPKGRYFCQGSSHEEIFFVLSLLGPQGFGGSQGRLVTLE